MVIYRLNLHPTFSGHAGTCVCPTLRRLRQASKSGFEASLEYTARPSPKRKSTVWVGLWELKLLCSYWLTFKYKWDIS